MRPFTLIVLLFALASFAAAQTKPTNTILDNIVSLRSVIGDKLSPVLHHAQFRDLIARLQSPDERSTVLLPLAQVWGDNPRFDDSMAEYYAQLLHHHTVPRTVISLMVRAAEPDWQLERSLLGDLPLRFRRHQGRVQVMSAAGFVANIVEADLGSSNGVIHLVDAPLLPPGFSIVDGRLVVQGVNDGSQPASTQPAASTGFTPPAFLPSPFAQGRAAHTMALPPPPPPAPLPAPLPGVAGPSSLLGPLLAFTGPLRPFHHGQHVHTMQFGFPGFGGPPGGFPGGFGGFPGRFGGPGGGGGAAPSDRSSVGTSTTIGDAVAGPGHEMLLLPSDNGIFDTLAATARMRDRNTV